MCSQRIESLETYGESHVSVRQLSRYWQVDRRTIRKWIDNGDLPATKLGPTVCRVRTIDALTFERTARLHAS